MKISAIIRNLCTGSWKGIGLILCVLVSLPVQAIKKSGYEPSITHVSTRVKGDKLHVAFILELGETPVKTQHKRTLTPMVRTADGHRCILLPPVVLKGRNRSIMEQKNHGEQDDTEAFRVFSGKECKNIRMDYHAVTSYQSWMEQAVVMLKDEVTGCAECGITTCEYPVQDYAVYAPQLRLSPQAECAREFVARTERRDAFLIYPVNGTRLYAQRYGNQAELAKIDSAVTYVRSNPNYEIKSIAIAGYASPEGSYTHNLYLAKARAQALYDYMCNRYNLPDSLMAVTTGEENWEGLVKALEDYELPYKDEVLNTISQTEDPDRRDEALKQIGGGVPYHTLLHAIYPTLRKNTCCITYTSKERTIEEARKLVFTRPSELNPYEFYRVADSCYAVDLKTYRRVLKIAANTYPQHTVANLNAARICLEEEDLEGAARYLERTDQSAVTWNTRACLLWKRGDREEAMVWWRKAAAAGDACARWNLEEAGKR